MRRVTVTKSMIQNKTLNSNLARVCSHVRTAWETGEGGGRIAS